MFGALPNLLTRIASMHLTLTKNELHGAVATTLLVVITVARIPMAPFAQIVFNRDNDPQIGESWTEVQRIYQVIINRQ